MNWTVYVLHSKEKELLEQVQMSGDYQSVRYHPLCHHGKITREPRIDSKYGREIER